MKKLFAVETTFQKSQVTVHFKPHIEAVGRRLDAVLSGQFSFISRVLWQNRIKAGDVLVNNQRIKPAHRISIKDEITICFEKHPEPEVNTDYKILHEDRDILVVDKPPNLPVHPSGSYYENTLLSLLSADRKEDLKTVHRIDRETSGLVLLARTSQAAAFISLHFKEKTIKKEYLGIVEGNFPESLHCRGVIGPDFESAVHAKKKFRFETPRTGLKWQSCETFFHCVQQSNGLSLVRAELITGRTHQVRASLLAAGYPLAGDKLYGLDENYFLKFISNQLTDDDRKKLRLGRSALHNCLMKFKHPSTSEYVTFTSELPADMKKIL